MNVTQVSLGCTYRLRRDAALLPGEVARQWGTVEPQRNEPGYNEIRDLTN